MNELKQVNGGMGPGEHIVAQYYLRKAATPAINVALLTYEAISDWW